MKSFRFYVLEFCDVASLNDVEKYWISCYNTADRNTGYNIERGGNDCGSVSEETRKIMSRNRRGELNQRAKMSEETAKSIVKMLVDGEMCKDIAEHFNVNIHSVLGIRGYSTWKHLTNGVVFPRRCSSKYYGIQHNRSGSFRVVVRHSSTVLYDKSFATEEEAVIAREHWIDEHIAELHGSHPKRNDISQISVA